eukprot:2963400-Amphidinium_carterae.1
MFHAVSLSNIFQVLSIDFLVNSVFQRYATHWRPMQTKEGNPKVALQGLGATVTEARSAYSAGGRGTLMTIDYTCEVLVEQEYAGPPLCFTSTCPHLGLEQATLSGILV